MTKTTKSLEKREAGSPAAEEQTREGKVFVPYVDIYEDEDSLVVLADMPGVDEENVDVDLESDVLTISGAVKKNEPDGYRQVLAEYETGNYRRSFTLSDTVDAGGIEASIKDGVLRLVLPKAEEAKPKRIAVKAG